MKIAVITGASSGLGKEFFLAAAEQFPQLEEFWLVARREEKLRELAALLPQKNVRILPMDLTKEESIDSLEQLFQDQQPEIGLLVNNAGFGTLGNFDAMERPVQTKMIDLNVRALTALTSAALPFMKHGSAVVNVCSIASFAPNPRMTVYCSTKAYVMSFSRSLREELKPRGINVLSVCPGPMRTEFLPAAGIESGSSKTFDTLPYCDPKQVAAGALRSARQGKAVYTNRLFFKFYRVLAKLLPHGFVMKFSKA
ncbi:MAG: SDR family NAD(P)-dependent oxidoreductase [Firmicutes bacterium]|nr:SDR family NAD(P)-dependent oxidoreductase [Bacillota bacterium]